MFCPNDDCPDYLATGLRAEYRDEVLVCPFCGTPLVYERPSAAPVADVDLPAKPPVADDEELEPVIEATDPTEVPIIKSMLDAAGIPYLTRGEDPFNSFRGVFASGSIFHPRSSGVIFVVPSRMADEARTLLEALEAGADKPEEGW